MKTILVLDKNYKSNNKFNFFQKTVSSLVLNGNNYEVKIDDKSFISLFDIKIKSLRKFLSNYADDEIVMLIDALDTYLLAKDEEIEKKFLRFNCDILYSVELNCWPNERFKPFFDVSSFLNSGGVIFKNSAFQKLLDIIIAFVDKNNTDGLNSVCDQHIHSFVYLIYSLDLKCKLDTNNEIFQSLCFENEENIVKMNNRFLNKKTNTHPCVLHGNGADGLEKLTKIIISFNSCNL